MKTNLNQAINGLPIPPALVEAIHSGRWAVPPLGRLEAAFPEAVYPSEPIRHPAFFDLDGMARENDGWSEEAISSYLGSKDDKLQPGDIDPRQSVVIADLGPDRLIALDYRTSEEKPRVMYLTGNEHARWIEAAPDIESLLHVLGL